MPEDKLDPTTTSLSYRRMAPKWRKIEALLGGTDAMRAAGTLYAPQHEYEPIKQYNSRIAATTLLNMVEQTLNSLASKPFSDPIQLGDDIPERIKDSILPNVDLQGNNIGIFGRDWFKEGLAKSFAHVLVDSPKPKLKKDGTTRTLDDDRKEGVRPYWVFIKPENIIGADVAYIDGIETLTRVRILEEETVNDGFSQSVRQKVRVLLPGAVQIHERESGKKSAKWKITEEWKTGLSYIPLVTFYANKEGFMEGKPPLLDLADKNIEHWASASEQRNILTVARFPILGGAGVNHDDTNPIVLGPRRALTDSDPDSKYYYIEHSGAAIEAGRQDLQDIEQQMAGYGAEFLKKKLSGNTATERVLDSAESSSDLSSMAVIFEDAVAQALKFTADWMGIKELGGSVQVVKDFNENDNTAGLELLDKARARRDISRSTLLSAYKRHNVLSDDFDEEKDLLALADEPPQIFGITETNIDPAQ